MKYYLVLLILFSLNYSCGGPNKKKSSSSSKKKINNVTKTHEKKAKKLHRDPCSEAGRCIGVAEIPYTTAEQKLKAAKQIDTEQRQKNNFLKSGERLIYSHLTLMSNEDNQSNQQTNSANCYVLHTEVKEFIESKDNVAINMGKPLQKDDFSSFDIFFNEDKDFKLLNETPTCQKLFTKHKEQSLVAESWEAFDTKYFSVDFLSNQAQSIKESNQEIKVEISEKLFKLHVDGKPSYRFEIIRRNIDRNTNEVIETNNRIHMISTDLAISSQVIYSKEESFNNKNRLTGYSSKLLMEQKVGEPSNPEFPEGFIVQGSNENLR